MQFRSTIDDAGRSVSFFLSAAFNAVGRCIIAESFLRVATMMHNFFPRVLRNARPDA